MRNNNNKKSRSNPSQLSKNLKQVVLSEKDSPSSELFRKFYLKIGNDLKQRLSAATKKQYKYLPYLSHYKLIF